MSEEKKELKLVDVSFKASLKFWLAYLIVQIIAHDNRFRRNASICGVDIPDAKRHSARNHAPDPGAKFL
ncbi:MAG: hypothetical protein QXM52_04030 [Candidatus Bathyarchaeia archaeon]